MRPTARDTSLIADGDWREAALTFDRGFLSFDDAHARSGRGWPGSCSAGAKTSSGSYWAQEERQVGQEGLTLARVRAAPLGARANPNRQTQEIARPWRSTRTFSIIKPDATRRNLTGAVTKMLEDAGLRVVASQAHPHDPRAGRGLLRGAQGAALLQRSVRLHDRPARSSCRCSRARTRCKRNRDVMGATNPANADEGTIRKTYAEMHRGEHRPRLGQRRECEDRDRLSSSSPKKSSADHRL